MDTAAVIPFDRAPTVAREDYSKAIQLWCQTRDTAAALSKEEIGALGRHDRIDAQRKAIILALAHYYRKHERSDVAPGVAVVLTLLSDNETGAATISQPTLAKLFGRSRSAIAEAQAKLRDDGIIKTSRGRYAATYPVIPRAVTASYNHMTWLIDAVCTQDASFNRPAGQDDYQSSDGTLRLNQSLGGTLPLNPVNRSVDDVSIVRPDPTLLHLLNSKEVRGDPPKEVGVGKVAAAIAATFVSVLPVAAAPHHPVEQVMAGAAECWQTPKAQMTAATNAHEARAQKQVWVTPTGLVEVAGDFRAELVTAFPLVDLHCGLSTAAVHVKPDFGAIRAMQDIRRQFGFMQSDAAAKEKRAASYRKPNSSAEPTEKPADMPQVVWDRMQAAKAKAGAC